MARDVGGQFLLRIEDIDQTRARAKWIAQIKEDLTWLGVAWDAQPLLQSQNLQLYSSALDDLWARGLLYECHCNRRDIINALSAPQEGAPVGPDGLIYPGTCRTTSKLHQSARPHEVLRLNLSKALKTIEEPLNFMEIGIGPNRQTGLQTLTSTELMKTVGDIVLARRGMGTSYHLSVVVDDAAQGITHVVRGQDLFEATAIHVVLQKLLRLPSPKYHHHRLIRDENGVRLAKRDNAKAVALMRAQGKTVADIRMMIGA